MRGFAAVGATGGTPGHLQGRGELREQPRTVCGRNRRQERDFVARWFARSGSGANLQVNVPKA
ncbi:hypothetical protein GCM10022284_63070 [Streptomyces hundungensis]